MVIFMEFMKTMHNKMMSMKMSKGGKMMKLGPNRKKMMKEVRRRKGGKGESGEGE